MFMERCNIDALFPRDASECVAHANISYSTLLLGREESELQRFLRRSHGSVVHADSLPSEQALFPLHQMLVTSNVCFEQMRPGAWPLLPTRWFRHDSAGNRSNRRAANLCEERAPRITTVGLGGAWVAALSAVVPCAEVSSRTFQRHDYCFAPKEHASAPANDTTWLRGLTLFATERHSSNLNHFNRDVLFWHRVVRRWPDAVTRLVARDSDPLADWSAGHLSAVLPPRLVESLLWSHDPKHLSGIGVARKRNISSTVAPNSKYVCFEAIGEKVDIYSGDRDDRTALRASALRYCKLPAEEPPGELVLEVRGETNTTTRRVVNRRQLSNFLSGVARAACLTYREVIFSALNYCGQVAAVARARILVGIHGQGLSNSIFLHPDALLVELFAPNLGPVGGGSAALGHQPLALSGGMHYLGLQLAEPVRDSGEHCAHAGGLAWKLDPKCTSFVNVSKLGSRLDAARVLLPFRLPNGSILAAIAHAS